MPMRLPSEPRDGASYLKGYNDAKLDYEVRHGRWIVNKCSVCGFLATEWVGRCHYCPNCGADMRKSR